MEFQFVYGSMKWIKTNVEEFQTDGGGSVKFQTKKHRVENRSIINMHHFKWLI